jgi:hypothetical protein
MKYYKFLAGTGIFFVLMVGIFYVHVHFFPVNVLLYSAVFDGVLAAVVAAAVLFWTRAYAVFSNFEKLAMLLIWILSSYAMAITGPTIIDRSLSFYMLEKIAQRGGGIKLERFEDVFTKEYAKEHRLVDIRLTEQQASGTLTIDGDCVKLTERGWHLAKFSQLFRENLLPKHRLLMGTYTDVLTDPFRNSDTAVDYACH